MQLYNGISKITYILIRVNYSFKTSLVWFRFVCHDIIFYRDRLFNHDIIFLFIHLILKFDAKKNNKIRWKENKKKEITSCLLFHLASIQFYIQESSQGEMY